MESALEKKFAWTWLALAGPRLEREFRFQADRRWRFDFARPASRVAIELEGGVWNNGAHVRPGHFIADAEKYNAAAASGWRVFRLTREMIGVQQVQPIVQLIHSLENNHEDRPHHGPEHSRPN